VPPSAGGKFERHFSSNEAEPELPGESSEPFEALIGYLENNAYRGDYNIYCERGFQLGSGAMASLHRTAAQCRLKLAGACWTQRTSLAVVNLRLLGLVERWDELWAHDGLNDLLRSAFVNVCV